MRLYHGSNMEITEISLSKGRKGKDFGKGFYLSEDYMQAVKMSQIVVKREGEGFPVVTAYEFDTEAAKNLNVKVFEEYTEEWANFILTNRKNHSERQAHQYDIVIGPIANDAVGVQIRQFINGYISFDKFRESIRYTTPTIQYFFGTEESLKVLKKL